MSHTKTAGFTMVELLIALAIVGVIAAMALPGTSQWLANQRLVSSARSVASVLSHARGEAIKTGNVWIAFFGTDAAGASLSAANGDTVPILLLDDGRPGDLGQNCAIDSGEEIVALSFEPGITIGVTNASAKVPSDVGSGTLSTGSTLVNASGGDASWVMFRPNGIPLSFSNGCATGAIGSGGGGLYLTNGVRDMAIVLTPLGANRVYRLAPDGGTWIE